MDSREETFIEHQNTIRNDQKIKIKKRAIFDVWRNGSTKGLLFLLIFSIAVPVLIYYFLINRWSFPGTPHGTCSVSNTYKIPCGKTENVTLNYCDQIHCCFDNSTKRCFHFLPSKYYYSSVSDNLYEKSLKKSPFGKEQSTSIKLIFNELDEKRLQVILQDPGVTTEENRVLNAEYLYAVNETMFVDVYRNDTGNLLLTTSRGPTIISENYWEWSFQLTDEYLFGLGQTLIALDENSTFTKVVYGNDKDHNTLPIFMAYKNGSYHGLIIRHNGPLEISVLPSNLVSVKSLAGKQIILELSLGPTIKHVVAQQKPSVSVNLDMLGVHICREGDLKTLREILQDYENERSVVDPTDDIEYTSDCFHENLIIALRKEKPDSTTIPRMVEDIKQYIIDPGYRFVLAIPPQVSNQSLLYNTTKQSDVFFKLEEEDYQGQYLADFVVYPYFKHPSVDDFIQTLIDEAKSFFSSVWPNDFILGKNWPSDESFEMDQIENFQYLSQDLIDAMSFTLPWNVSSGDSLQFLDHNEYGDLQLQKIKNALQSENPSIMTASHTFETVDPIIIQNVDLSWTNFQNSITTILSNGLFGFPLTSVPVCGSTSTFNKSQESLCMRWYLMASTSPMFRISSDLPRRDPISLASYTSQLAGNIAKEAIEFRYSLLHYFYAVLNNGESLMRPMFYDFPDDINTFGLVEQYMVGPDLLVAHPTLPDQNQIKVYLPKGVNTWYYFDDGAPFNSGNWTTLFIVETDWVRFIREGAIVVLAAKKDVVEVTLKIALKCDSDTNCSASGSLIVDESNSFTFTSSDSELKIEQQGENLDQYVLTKVEVFRADGTSRYFLGTGQLVMDLSTCSYTDFSC